MSIYQPLWELKTEIQKKKAKIKLMECEIDHLKYITNISCDAIYSDDEKLSKKGKEYYEQWKGGYLSDYELIYIICDLLNKTPNYQAMAMYYEILLSLK